MKHLRDKYIMPMSYVMEQEKEYRKGCFSKFLKLIAIVIVIVIYYFAFKELFT